MNALLTWTARFLLPAAILLALFRAELLVFFGGWNLAVFIMYYEDKHRARANQWRIPEQTLLLAALLGGAVGAELGRMFSRHKTQKLYFSMAVCAGMLLNVYALVQYRQWMDPPTAAPSPAASSKADKPASAHHVRKPRATP